MTGWLMVWLSAATNTTKLQLTMWSPEALSSAVAIKRPCVMPPGTYHFTATNWSETVTGIQRGDGLPLLQVKIR